MSAWVNLAISPNGRQIDPLLPLGAAFVTLSQVISTDPKT